MTDTYPNKLHKQHYLSVATESQVTRGNFIRGDKKFRQHVATNINFDASNWSVLLLLALYVQVLRMCTPIHVNQTISKQLCNLINIKQDSVFYLTLQIKVVFN